MKNENTPKSESSIIDEEQQFMVPDYRLLIEKIVGLGRTTINFCAIIDELEPSWPVDMKELLVSECTEYLNEISTLYYPTDIGKFKLKRKMSSMELQDSQAIMDELLEKKKAKLNDL